MKLKFKLRLAKKIRNELTFSKCFSYKKLPNIKLIINNYVPNIELSTIINFAKGSLPNKKCHKLWKKSIRGGRGVSAKIKIVYISNVDKLWLRGGGSEFFRFFPNLNNWNMTLIFMIYRTDIGEIYATFGSYIACIYE